MVNRFAVFKSDIFSGVTPLCSFGIFVWFAYLEIGSIKWINNIAGTTFGAYLIHDADISRALMWHIILRVDTVQYAGDSFPIYATLSIGGVFCCCSWIDLGRKKWIEPWATERFQGLMKRAKCLMCEWMMVDWNQLWVFWGLLWEWAWAQIYCRNTDGFQCLIYIRGLAGCPLSCQEPLFWQN